MTLTEIKNRLIKLKPELHTQFGVSEIGIFGSWVRGEQKRGSDIDVLVDFDREVSLFNILELKYLLEDKFRKNIDIAYKNALKPTIGKQILEEVQYL